MSEILNFLKKIQSSLVGFNNTILHHHTRHEDSGSDEINVAGLSGELADPQTAKAHTLASHSTKAHSELTGVTASQHHSKTIASDLNLADMAEKNHNSLDNVSPNQHHNQSHSLASHSTKAHSELTGVTASQHHSKTTSSEIDHGSVQGLGDNDHLQYLLKSLLTYNACGYRSSNQNNIPLGVYTKVQLNVELWDIGGNFANGRFTATIPGYYQVDASILWGSNIMANHLYNGVIYKNGSLHIQTEFHSSIVAPISTPISRAIYLAQNDYIELWAFHQEPGIGTSDIAGHATGKWTYMSVHLFAPA